MGSGGSRASVTVRSHVSLINSVTPFIIPRKNHEGHYVFKRRKAICYFMLKQCGSFGNLILRMRIKPCLPAINDWLRSLVQDPPQSRSQILAHRTIKLRVQLRPMLAVILTQDIKHSGASRSERKQQQLATSFIRYVGNFCFE